MEKHVITHNGKDYIVNEPTIEQWIKLVGMKDWEDELEFGTRLIQEMTGLTKKEIQQSDWYNIISVSQNISNTILQQSKEFHKEFEFEGVKYRFIDLPNLTFGEFVDIDSILSKPDIERQRQIHVLMAMLYREVDDKGKLTEYDGSKIQERSEKFKKLPVRYVNGATTFFFLIERVLQSSSPLSSLKRLTMRLRVIWKLSSMMISVSFGVGFRLWFNWLKKTSRRLIPS
jgi:hypothetical protein